MFIKEDAEKIIKQALQSCLPDKAVRRALEGKKFGKGKIVLVAIGKAAWQMAECGAECLGERLSAGIVITKYGHSKGRIEHCTIVEAGHPVPDENSFVGTRQAIKLVENLNQEDTVIFLISGGGSALFENPLISPEELSDLTNQLLNCGANIVEMNTIRKRISAVKGGKFAKICEPAKVYAVVLSDILGDPLDMIASGPACSDSSTCEQALEIIDKYQIPISEKILQLLKIETPKFLNNVETVVTGSVKELCRAAAKTCEELGYKTTILTDQLECQAREAGSMMASIARTYKDSNKPIAFIAGGETVVKVKGNGKGGRNQELALAAAEGIAGLENVVVFSVGSDGTDGPTDAAGGIVNGLTARKLHNLGIDIHNVLERNDAYSSLKQVNGLIFTGPTVTNVNDIACVLISTNKI